VPDGGYGVRATAEIARLVGPPGRRGGRFAWLRDGRAR